MQIKLKGDASQWQKALYVASFTGKEVEGLIRKKKWIPKTPQEGVKYYDVILKKLDRHYKRYADMESAHERLMSATQRVDETITQFHERLSKIAVACEIRPNGHIVRNVMAKGIKDTTLKHFASLTKMSIK